MHADRKDRIIDELLDIVEQLIQKIPDADHVSFNTADRLAVVAILSNSLKIEGTIMKVQFRKAQKVTATIGGSNATNPNAPITGLGAVSSDPTIFTIGKVDQVANTVELLGVADGSASVIYTANNDEGTALTLTDQVVIDDTINTTADTLNSAYSTPVEQ